MSSPCFFPRCAPAGVISGDKEQIQTPKGVNSYLCDHIASTQPPEQKLPFGSFGFHHIKRKAIQGWGPAIIEPQWGQWQWGRQKKEKRKAVETKCLIGVQPGTAEWNRTEGQSKRKRKWENSAKPLFSHLWNGVSNGIRLIGLWKGLNELIHSL